MDRQRRNWFPIIFIILLFVFLVAGYLWFSQKQGLLSPVPPKTSFQVIYYTPTPGITTPTSTPSATIKPAKITATVAPTKAVTPTVKTSPSPTVKPT